MYLAGVLAVFGLGLAFLSPVLFNIQYVFILTGSMAPTMPEGTLAVIRPVNPDDIEVGDVITFRRGNDSDALVTHRVVEVLADEDGSSEFRTKGDASEVVDKAPVPAEGVKGKVLASMPFVRYHGESLSTRNVILAVGLLAGMLVVANEVWSFMRSSDPRRKALDRRRRLRTR